MKIGLLWNDFAFRRDFAIADADAIIKGTGSNTGNMAYVEGILSLLQEGTYKFLPWHADRQTVRENADILIFPAANQLGPHTDLGELADRFHSWGLPVLVLGLGAQFKDTSNDITLTDGTRRWLNTLIDLAPVSGVPNIITRGDFTLEVLHKLGHLDSGISAGCPSQFINLTLELGRSIQQRVRNSDFFSLAYNASHYSWSWAKHIDLSARDYMLLNCGGYQIQAPPDMISWARSTDYFDIVYDHSTTRNFIADDMSNEEFYKFSRRYVTTFSSVPSWREWLVHFDFSFGTRIHGAMLALQSAVPSLLVAHDTRTHEMALKMSVPYVHIKDLTVSGRELIGLVKKTLREFDYQLIDKSRLHNAKLYLDFFRANGVPISKDFQTFIDQSLLLDSESGTTKSRISISAEISNLITPRSTVLEIGLSGSCINIDRKNVRSRFLSTRDIFHLEDIKNPFDYFIAASGLEPMEVIPYSICRAINLSQVCIFKLTEPFVETQIEVENFNAADGIPRNTFFSWMRSIGMIRQNTYNTWKFKLLPTAPSIYIFSRTPLND